MLGTSPGSLGTSRFASPGLRVAFVSRVRIWSARCAEGECTACRAARGFAKHAKHPRPWVAS